MSKKIPGNQKPIGPSDWLKGPGGEAPPRVDRNDPAKGAGEAARAQERLQEIDLPEKMPGISGEPSQLQSVIQAGLSSLAKANNWEATDNALGVLVKAMVGAGAAKKTGDAVPVPASLSLDFQRLLKAHVEPGDAEALVKLKGDAKQLVQLATVALGMEGLEGLPKAKQEAQLEADVKAIHGALSDVMKLPAEQRSQLLGTTNDLVQWKANVLDRSQKALDAAGIDTRGRLDALAGILRIVSSYANPAS